MRKARIIENCRCYHLISRLYPPAVRLLAKRGAMRGAHQAFFLDDDEKTRAVELLRRVEEFSGVIVLAYAIMSNHFDIFRQTVRTLVLTIHHRTLPVYTFTHLHIKGRGASPVEYPPAGVWKGQT